MQIAELKRNKKTIEVELDEGVLSVVYRPGAYTAEIEMMLAEAEKQPLSTMCRIVEKVVESWDLMDGEVVFPVVFEALATLPAGFLLRVMQAIAEDMRPNPTM